MWLPEHDGTQCMGHFLRSRRDRLAPDAVGLPTGSRRRTPGLRREEVATLAGISVDYLVRLEQGREHRPSVEVMDALGRALRLSGDERAHLGRLAELAVGRGRGATPPPERKLSRTSLALVERMGDLPAYVVDGLTEVVAWSRGFEALMAPAGFFDRDPPHMLRFVFLDGAARSLFPDWDEIARSKVAHLGPEVIRAAGDPRVVDLMGELTVASPEFARMWADHEVVDKRRGTFRMAHPVAGDLTLDYESLVLPDPGSLHLVVYMPADGASEEALDGLLVAAEGRPATAGRLRLVSDSA